MAPDTTEMYSLSLHDALPIWGGAAVPGRRRPRRGHHAGAGGDRHDRGAGAGDRKSTRLNSSHVAISYAVFCLKKKRGPSTRSSSYGTSARGSWDRGFSAIWQT